jgi:transposase-like protein
MDTVSNNTLPELTAVKRRVLAACTEPGASIAAVARHYQLNANLVHKWRKAVNADFNQTSEPPGFLALPVPPAMADADSKVTLTLCSCLNLRNRNPARWTDALMHGERAPRRFCQSPGNIT